MIKAHALTKRCGDTTAVDTGGHAGAGGGPVPASRRSWAPDLARGAVLLGIALANVGLYLHGTEMGPNLRPVDDSPLDRMLDFVVTLLVSDRSRPMFALTFGFGLVTMARRLGESGTEPRAQRSVLLRRQLLLIAFGGVHAALLFEGDILGIYGATGLVLLLLMNRRPRVLVAWGTVSLVLLGALYAVFALAPDSPAAPSDYLASVVERLSVWVLGVVVGPALMIVLAPMLVGVAMARGGLLDRPWEHVALLRRLAVLGSLVGVAGSLPYALVVARVWEPGTVTSGALAAVHAVTGTAMGVAYVCLFALWAARLHERRDPRRRAPAVLAAVGERSLTCYLLQSMILAPLLSPWGLGLGEGMGTATAYGIAFAVWLFTVAVACSLAVSGRRGPFEVLLRRLTYGPRPAAPVPVAFINGLMLHELSPRRASLEEAYMSRTQDAVEYRAHTTPTTSRTAKAENQ